MFSVAKQVSCHDDIRGSGGIAPRILKLECSVSRSSRFTPGERDPGAYWCVIRLHWGTAAKIVAFLLTAVITSYLTSSFSRLIEI
jgi:hypothetical protein